MKPAFDQARVKLRTDFDPDANVVNADAEQLWQAILNLLQNSLEAMPAGGALSVSTGRESGHVMLRIRDSGKGMTPAQLKQVFVPFFTTKPRGTGLGLSITQQVLNEHGAEIECNSSIDKGTSFSIRFPFSKES